MNSYEPKYDGDTVTKGYLDKVIKNLELDSSSKEESKSSNVKNYGAPPSPPYYLNSLLAYSGKIYRCRRDKIMGEFSWDDWEVVATNDSELNNFVENTYSTDKLQIQEQIDGKIQSYYQDTDPALEWTTDILKSKHKGDYWYNSSNNTQWRYTQLSTNPITYMWKPVDIPLAVYNQISSKKSIYTSKPNLYCKDDLWIIENTILDDDIPIGTEENPITKGDWVFALQDSDHYDKNHWIKKDENVSKEYLEDHYYNISDFDLIREEIDSSVDSKISRSKEQISLEVASEYTKNSVYEAQVADYDQQLGNINRDITEHGGKITGLELEDGRIREHIEDFTESITGLEDSIESINGSVDSIYSSVNDTLTTHARTIEFLQKTVQDGVPNVKSKVVKITMDEGLTLEAPDESIFKIQANVTKEPETTGFFIYNGTEKLTEITPNKSAMSNPEFYGEIRYGKTDVLDKNMFVAQKVTINGVTFFGHYSNE